MALLSLDRVSKRFAHGQRGVRERIALRNVSLELDAGELVAVLGRRRSGRTTLLQVAAGLEPPSEGQVRFAGAALGQLLGVQGGIGYCTTRFASAIGDSAIEHVAAPLLGSGVPILPAQTRAHEVLRRVGAGDCAELGAEELDTAETIRVAIARAIVAEPQLLLLDEPTLGVRLTERDALLELIGALAHDDGIAVLMTVDSATELAGCDRALSLDAGELRGETAPTTAAVLPLRRSQAETPR
ncbi:MAG: ATP-binding cassette domain-containing protein [Conexibacter sp.]